jgi:hypothetical protein
MQIFILNIIIKGNGTKPALFLGLRPTQGSYLFKPFTTSKEENISARIH